MIRSLLTVGLSLAVVGPFVASAQENAGQEGPVLRDRILAVVDGNPILASDVERVIVLGIAEPEPGEGDSEFRRRVLAGLVEQRLRFQEVDRHGLDRVSTEAVDRQMEEIRQRFGGASELGARLEDLGMTDGDLRQLLARQVEVMSYVEELLGARIFVDVEEIQRYYDSELGPRLERQGTQAPPIAEVREQIREVLRQEKLNEELEAWTEELRAEADVIVLFDRPNRPLPPVVRTIE